MVEHLAEVHHDALVNLLPEMRPKDLNERNLERWNLAVHKDACEVELHLEANVHGRPVDRRTPPEGKAAVGNLIEARALRVRQALILHALLKAARLFPKEALPGGKVGALE